MSVGQQMERQELAKKLIDNGFGKLVEALMDTDSKVYTKKGRLNKCGACRALEWKTKQLEDALKECRIILGDDAF